MTVPLYNLTDTWNAGATVFTAIKIDVTDTASAATSLLFDLQIASVTKFSVNKTGGVLAGDYSAFGTGAAIVDDTIIQVQDNSVIIGSSETYWGIHVDIDATSSGTGSNFYGIEISLLVPNTNTGDFNDYFGMTFQTSFRGSGDVVHFRGVQGTAAVNDYTGAITVDVTGGFLAAYVFSGDASGAARISGLYVESDDETTTGGGCPLVTGVHVGSNFGSNITAGVYITDQSGNFGTANYSLVAKGATARGLIEGILKFGTGTNASPENGDVWFDGTDLKLRTGGVTRTFTVA